MDIKTAKENCKSAKASMTRIQKWVNSKLNSETNLFIVENKMSLLKDGFDKFSVNQDIIDLATPDTQEPVDRSLQEDLFSELSARLAEKMNPQKHRAVIDSTQVLVNNKTNDKECEEIFQRTTKRDSDGRLIVTIPLKKPVSLLGESKDAALKRLNGLETRLRKNANLSNLYRTFTQEHMSVGHMSTIYNNQEINQISYYMPHYGMINKQNQTTKLRVVFDASAPTSTGVSFNQLQYVGPTIQDDLVAIIQKLWATKVT
ncbi:uncharacterized protein LOC114335826 [Diabrotica virgifera virgifera]|uniref:Uncharacterized protein n=1 Tax=Diabrotica virgifera virgifera TaxID=50390 RepID=A0ABM5KRY7_DIAVI|nr:uncharacterized protein LOC114335826 [Diabrotica virgifera virgifera]